MTEILNYLVRLWEDFLSILDDGGNVATLLWIAAVWGFVWGCAAARLNVGGWWPTGG